MLKKKDKTATPDLVETTCTCSEHVDEHVDTLNTAVPASDPDPSTAPEQAAPDGEPRHWSQTRAYRIYQKVCFVVLGLIVIGLFGKNLMNMWLDRTVVSTQDGKERTAWSATVEKMSPLEAVLTETQLVLRASQKQPNDYTGGDVFGDMSATAEGGDDQARLALFYVARHRRADAIAALERSLHVNDAKTFNPGYEEWRWLMLRDFYVQQGDFNKAAALVEKLTHKSYYVRAPDGDDLGFHVMAKDTFAKVGWNAKADQEEQQIQRAKLMPKHYSVENTTAYEYSRFRESKFKYATIALSEAHPQDALRALTELVTDQEALRSKVDRKEFLAAANMLIPVAQVEAGDWESAARNFPKALRLAAAEKALEYDCDDAKPALYQGYAKFLEHQGKSGEAQKYRRLSEAAVHAKRATATYDVGGQRVNASVVNYADSDLYPPELMK